MKYPRLLQVLIFLLGLTTTKKISSLSFDELKQKLNLSYDNAVEDAKNATRNKKHYKLTKIHPENKNLIWNTKNVGGKTLSEIEAQANLDPKVPSHISCTSFMPGTYLKTYFESLGTGDKLTVNFEMWITASPKLLEFISDYKKNQKQFPVVTRVQQLLGLPIKNGKHYLVNVWVRPEDMIRPTPDSEVVDEIALNDASEQTIEGKNFNFDIFDHIKAPEEYVTWYKNRRANAYTKGKPEFFPWTRLGYTYDWGKKGKDKNGLSEFLVKKGSNVLIRSIDELPDPVEELKTLTKEKKLPTF